MKQLRYATVTLRVVIPVYSHTQEEGRAIALDSLPDIVTNWNAKEFELARTGEIPTVLSKPDFVADGTIVWGDGVPEDHCTVDQLTRYLAAKS